MTGLNEVIGTKEIILLILAIIMTIFTTNIANINGFEGPLDVLQNSVWMGRFP